MAMALHDPELGYYATRRPIGAAGDFMTAPEISQIFGELIGLWCALVWQRIGRPDPRDPGGAWARPRRARRRLLRAAGAVPEFRRALRLHLVEASPVLRAEQQRRLACADPVWLTRVEDLPAGPLLLVANEFLDALPIRQFVRGRRHWSERMVALDREGRLVFADGPENPALSLLVPETLRDTARPGARLRDLPAGARPGGVRSARGLTRDPGAALFIDYGYFPSRAGVEPARASAPPAGRRAGIAGKRRSQRPCRFRRLCRAPLARPAPKSTGRCRRAGFSARSAPARGSRPCRARATPAQRRQLESGVERLLDPAQMGDLFKVVALASPGLPTPAGFRLCGSQQR